MFETRTISTENKGEFYRELAAQLSGLLQGEDDLIANAATPRH